MTGSGLNRSSVPWQCACRVTAKSSVIQMMNNLKCTWVHNAFNTVLNIQKTQKKKKKKITPQISQNASSVVWSPGSSDVLQAEVFRCYSPSLCFVWCDLTAAVQFSSERVNISDRHGRDALGHRCQLGQQTFINLFSFKITLVQTSLCVFECLQDAFFQMFRTRRQPSHASRWCGELKM